jgi:hypothetical protein
MSVCDCVCTCEEGRPGPPRTGPPGRPGPPARPGRTSRRVMFRDECDCEDRADRHQRTANTAAPDISGGRGGPGRRCDCCPIVPPPKTGSAAQEEHYQSPKDVDGDYSYAYR